VSDDLAALPSPLDFPVLVPAPTRWGDDDVYGHVNNVVYYSLFDTAVNGWLIQAAGTDIRRLPAIGLVAETSCRFLAPTGFPDRLQIGLALEHVGRSSIVYRLAAFRENADGAPQQRPSALGRFVHVYVDQLTRRPVPIPAVIRGAVASLTGTS
jgi:acyl-CoA thioester hydrolase